MIFCIEYGLFALHNEKLNIKSGIRPLYTFPVDENHIVRFKLWLMMSKSSHGQFIVLNVCLFMLAVDLQFSYNLNKRMNLW